MKKHILASVFIFCFCILSSSSYADAIYSILNSTHHLEDLQSNMLNTQNNVLRSQQDVENLMKSMNGSMVGNSGWGTYQFHDFQSYGDDAKSWLSVLEMAERGDGFGALGQTLNSISSQFPIDQNDFNKGVPDAKTEAYYLLQSQTVLATRAASQLDYDKVQDQINYQQMLQQQIEKTQDLKSAVDLNNRIQIESNLINLEILRQSAMANQQQAISEQINMGSALSNAKFLTKS